MVINVGWEGDRQESQLRNASIGRRDFVMFHTCSNATGTAAADARVVNISSIWTNDLIRRADFRKLHEKRL